MIKEIYKHSKIATLLGITSIATGAYAGYCNAKGIPISNELAFIAGPALVQGMSAGAFTSFFGAGLGGRCSLSDYTCGFTLGAAKGGIETIIGYTAGYTLGCLPQFYIGWIN